MKGKNCSPYKTKTMRVGSDSAQGHGGRPKGAPHQQMPSEVKKAYGGNPPREVKKSYGKG